MATVLEVTTLLEKAVITKETLEKTRIGKYVNALRKRTHNEQLARRAKELVKSWRKLLPSSSVSINGEQVTGNAGTILGPGPGPGFGPGPGPGQVDKVLKTSPSVYERSTSPLCSSVSSSPQSATSKLSASNRSTPSNYAPSKLGSTAIRNNKSCTGNKTISCQIFKPISPALACSVNSNSTVQFTIDSLSQPKTQDFRISPNLSTSSQSSSSLSNSSAMKSPTCGHKFEISTSPHHVASSDNAHSSLEIAKTNAANKRLRKARPVSIRKKKCVINETSSNGVAVNYSNMFLPSESNLHLKSIEEHKNNTCGNLKSKKSLEKLSCFTAGTKLKKVKTTQQLIEELQAKKDAMLFNSFARKQDHDSDTNNFLWKKSSNDSVPNDELLKSKSELMKKFLSESPTVDPKSPVADRVSSPLSDNFPSKSSVIISDKDLCGVSYVDPIEAEIEQILSSLPPLNPEEINLCDEDKKPLSEKKISFSDDDMNKLENESLEYVNGNVSADGSFKHWHECVEAEIKPGELFRILPYVNIN